MLIPEQLLCEICLPTRGGKARPVLLLLLLLTASGQRPFTVP